MALKDLSAPEQQIVLQCMRAIAEGNEIDDPEFHSRLGITREILGRIIASWPEIDDQIVDSDEFLAVNNCLNEVCHGIRLTSDEWARQFTVPRESVKQAYSHWLRLGGWTGGIR